MHTWNRALSSLILPGTILALLLVFPTGAGFGQPEPALAQELEIEVTIQNFTYLVTKWPPPRLGRPLLLTIKNQDGERHGFQSELFHDLQVRAELEGVLVYGNGIEGLYLDPGKTVRLRFQVDRPGDYRFKCDLHPSMQGELLLMHVDVA